MRDEMSAETSARENGQVIQSGAQSPLATMNPRTFAAVLGLLFVFLFILVLGGMSVMDESGTLTEQWVSDTSRQLQANHHPVAAEETDDGVIIVAPINELSTVDGLTDTSCALVRLNPSTGSSEWQAGLPAANCTNHALTGPSIADIDEDGTEEVLVATSDNTLDAYDAETGEREWRHRISTLGYSEPAVGDLLPAPGKEVVVADIRGRVYAVYANGTTAWHRNHSTSTWANPQIADFDGDGTAEVAIATGQNTTLYETNGDGVWQTNAAASWSSTGQADDDEAPELFVARQGEVVALDGEDGRTIWSRSFDSVTSIHAVEDGDNDGTDEVYVGLSGGTVQALDATDGSDEWTTQLPGENRVMPPPALGDVDGDGSPELVAMAQEGVVYVLNPNSGDQLAAYEREIPIWTYPALADIDDDGDEDILVMYGDGRVVALSYSSS